MIRPSPLWNTEPATPELFSRRISRLKVPWAVRENSSFVAASFRNSVPRSALVSLAVISTSVASRSSRLSMTATRCESLMSISVRRRRPRSSAMLSRGGAGGREPVDLAAGLALTAMVLFQLFAQARDGAAELAQFVLAGPRLFLELVGVFVAEPLQLVPQQLDGAVQLAGIIVPRGDGGLHGRLLVELQGLQFVAQGGRGGAQLAGLVLGGGHGGLHRLVARGLHALQLGAKGLDGVAQLPELALREQHGGLLLGLEAFQRVEQRLFHRRSVSPASGGRQAENAGGAS